MSKSLKLALLTFLWLIGDCSQSTAQTLSNLRIDKTEFEIGTTVTVSIDFLSSESDYCGAVIDWGDNQQSSFRVGQGRNQVSPITMNKVYEKPGQYSIRVYGEFVTRGLRSASACEGQTRPVAISVVDPKLRDASANSVATKDRQDIERAKTELELERRRLELERKELELKAREVELERQKLKDTSLNPSQAKEQLRIAEEEKQKQAAEQERIAKEAEAKRIAAEKARLAEEEKQKQAAEQERIAKEAEAKRIAAGQINKPSETNRELELDKNFSLKGVKWNDSIEAALVKVGETGGTLLAELRHVQSYPPALSPLGPRFSITEVRNRAVKSMPVWINPAIDLNKVKTDSLGSDRGIQLFEFKPAGIKTYNFGVFPISWTFGGLELKFMRTENQFYVGDCNPDEEYLFFLSSRGTRNKIPSLCTKKIDPRITYFVGYPKQIDALNATAEFKKQFGEPNHSEIGRHLWILPDDTVVRITYDIKLYPYDDWRKTFDWESCELFKLNLAQRLETASYFEYDDNRVRGDVIGTTKEYENSKVSFLRRYLNPCAFLSYPRNARGELSFEAELLIVSPQYSKNVISKIAGKKKDF